MIAPGIPPGFEVQINELRRMSCGVRASSMKLAGNFSLLALTQAGFAPDGTGMPAFEQHIAYKRELHTGAAVTIRSTVLEMREKTVRMNHEMLDDSSRGSRPAKCNRPYSYRR